MPRLRTPSVEALLYVALAVSIWMLAMVPTGLLVDPLVETFDAAGFSLQAEIRTDQVWYTGQHSNTGVRHPGPFFLLLTGLGSLLSSWGIGAASTLGTQIALLAGVKVACLTWAAFLVSRAARSKAAGPMFLLAVAAASLNGPWDGQAFSWNYLDLLDLTGRGLQVAGASAMVLFCAAGVAQVQRVPAAPLALSISGGLLLHVHAGVALLGAVGLGIGMLWAWQGRQTSRGVLWASTLVTVAATVPLAARVLLEPGWPLSYITALQARHTQRSDEGATGTAFEALGNLVGLPTLVVVAILVLGAVIGALALTRPRVRPAGVLLLVVTLWTSAAALLGPGQQAAPELMWVGGIHAFVAGASGALILGWLSRQELTANGDALLSLALIPVTVLAWAVALPTTPANTAGPNGDHVAAAVEAVVATRQPIAWQLDATWLEYSAGPLLELVRRDIPFCVINAGGIAEDTLWFFTPDMHCQTGTQPTILALPGPGDANDQCTIYRWDPSVQEQELGAFPFHLVSAASAYSCHDRQRGN